MPYEFKHKPNVTFDDYLKRHEEWGHATFGSPADGRGPLGPLNHIEKEIVEIKEDPTDLKEWIDLIILGIDGFLRAGGKKTMLLPMLFAKQLTNAARNWPEWRGSDPTKAIEHVRTPEELAAKGYDGEPTFPGTRVKQSKTDAEALADIKELKSDKRRVKRNAEYVPGSSGPRVKGRTAVNVTRGGSSDDR